MSRCVAGSAGAFAVDRQAVGGVIESPTFDIDIGCLLKERHEPVSRPGHPRLAESLVVEGHDDHLEHVAGGAELGKHVGRCSRPLKRVRRKASIGLLEPPRAVDAVVDDIGRLTPRASEFVP